MFEKYKNLLSEFIRLKSVSTDTAFLEETKSTAFWLESLLKSAGFEVKIIEGYDNPIIIAKYTANPSYETCLIYGHYDVQPASLEDGWDSDPFELTERNGRLYARGAIDNKGQVLLHIVNIIELISSGSLGYNIKFLIEGNEETGSPHFEQFMRDYKDDLAANFALISDGEVVSGNPLIELGFRGGFNTTLTLKTSHTDLHSGLYGGAVPSASFEATKFAAKLMTENNEVAIKGFYDDVEPVSEEDRNNNLQIPFDFEEYKKLSGTKALKTEPGYDYYTQVALRPTIQITGINAGYTGNGYKNIVPSTSQIKVNFRLVKNQKPEKIAKLYEEYVKASLPEYVDYDLEMTDPYEGVKLDTNNKYVKKAIEVLTKAYGSKPYLKYNGGGLPVITHIDNILQIPQILAPIANEDCAMHAANENFELEHVRKAMEFSKEFFEK